jgi:methyl-accepting chemotaxis protein
VARFRRLRYLINTRLQLAYAGLVIWFVFNAILAIGATTYVLVLDTFLGELEEVGSDTVNAYSLVTNINDTLAWRIGLLVVVLLPLAGLLAIYFLHRLAGPIYKIHNTLKDVLDGKPVEPIVLRRSDYFGDLANEVNRLLEVHRQKDKAIAELTEALRQRPDLAPSAEQVARRLG